MRATQALLAASALVSSVSANCFYYRVRRYGLEHPELPGVALLMSVASAPSGDTYCYGTVTNEQAEEGVGSYTIPCEANGWFLTIQADLQSFTITTPDSDAAGENIVLPLDWDINDLGTGIGFLLSIDDSHGC